MWKYHSIIVRIDQLKIKFLQNIIECNDGELLLKPEKKFKKNSEENEPGEKHLAKSGGIKDPPIKIQQNNLKICLNITIISNPFI